MKKTIVFFDVEADLVSQKTDNKECIERVLGELRKRKIMAAFNVCGKVVEEFPRQVELMHSNGHEISSHMYNHESVLGLNEKELNSAMQKTEKLISEITGSKPIGFRSPWLYYNAKVYSVLRQRGYKWASNKRIRRAEIAEHPSLQFSDSNFLHLVNKLLLKTFLRTQWVFFPKKPFNANGLREIPLLSSMDGELLGLVDPNQNSSLAQLEFTVNSLQKQYFQAEQHFNLTFHDWLIGSKNRIKVLQSTLDFLQKQRAEFILPRELL